MGERRGKGKKRNTNRGLMAQTMVVGQGLTVGVWGGWGRGEQRGKMWDNYN